MREYDIADGYIYITDINLWGWAVGEPLSLLLLLFWVYKVKLGHIKIIVV